MSLVTILQISGLRHEVCQHLNTPTKWALSKTCSSIQRSIYQELNNLGQDYFDEMSKYYPKDLLTDLMSQFKEDESFLCGSSVISFLLDDHPVSVHQNQRDRYNRDLNILCLKSQFSQLCQIIEKHMSMKYKLYDYNFYQSMRSMINRSDVCLVYSFELTWDKNPAKSYLLDTSHEIRIIGSDQPLNSIDLSFCRCRYDGRMVVAHPDLTLQRRGFICTPSVFEFRLTKYLSRGFEIYPNKDQCLDDESSYQPISLTLKTIPGYHNDDAGRHPRYISDIG